MKIVGISQMIICSSNGTPRLSSSGWLFVQGWHSGDMSHKSTMQVLRTRYSIISSQYAIAIPWSSYIPMIHIPWDTLSSGYEGAIKGAFGVFRFPIYYISLYIPHEKGSRPRSYLLSFRTFPNHPIVSWLTNWWIYGSSMVNLWFANGLPMVLG